MTGCATRCHMSKLTVERHEIIELLGQLKLAGMRAAYDEVVAAGLRAQHSFQRIFGNEKRSFHRAWLIDAEAQDAHGQMETVQTPTRIKLLFEENRRFQEACEEKWNSLLLTTN